MVVLTFTLPYFFPRGTQTSNLRFRNAMYALLIVRYKKDVSEIKVREFGITFTYIYIYREIDMLICVYYQPITHAVEIIHLYHICRLCFGCLNRLH